MPERFTWIVKGQIAGMEKPGLFFPVEDDLAFLKSEGIDVIINLQEKEHFIDHRGFIMKNISIADFGPPEHEDFVEFMDFVGSNLAQKRKIVVHCYAGMGRTNLMLATFLVHKLAIHPDRALEEVKLNRPVHLVTDKQEEALREYYYVIRDTLNNS